MKKHLFTLLLVFTIGNCLAKTPSSFSKISDSRDVSYNISNVDNQIFKGAYLFALSKGSLIVFMASYGEQRRTSGKDNRRYRNTPIDYIGDHAITPQLKSSIDKFTFSEFSNYKCPKKTRRTDVVIKVSGGYILSHKQKQKAGRLDRKLCMTQKQFLNSALFTTYKSLPLKKLSIMANEFRDRTRNYSVKKIAGAGMTPKKALAYARIIAQYKPFRASVILRKPSACKRYLRKNRPTMIRFKDRQIRTLYYNPSLLKPDNSCYITSISNKSSVYLHSVLTVEGKHVGTFFWGF